jgi:hypothetical protein
LQSPLHRLQALRARTVAGLLRFPARRLPGSRPPAPDLRRLPQPFFTHNPDALTQLGWALKFYDISFRYAPTPQAKGKIERAHQYWQGRLPAYFASEKITEIEVANPHIDALRAHRNTHEVHRELRQTPQRAWDQARKEKRSALRPAPRCPWWDYIWSVRTPIRVGTDGRVPIGTQRLRIEKPPQTKVGLCLHPSGHHSVLATPSDHQQKPALLFTDHPI